MIYSQLSTEYKYDTLADAMYAREVELGHADVRQLDVFEVVLDD